MSARLMDETMRKSFGSQMAVTDRGGGVSRNHARADRTRRSWSDREEQFLLGILKDLVARGWKSDNGFRAGYLMKIEESMKKEFPTTDLKVNPHVLSKIHTWKKSYGALSLVLSRSGVGFNLNGDYKVDCDETEWKDILKGDGGMRALRNKSWPYYEDWKIVFGKDRACGTDAADARDCFNQTGRQATYGNIDTGSEYEEIFAEETGNVNGTLEAQADSVFSTTKVTSTADRSKKKRKTGDALGGLVDLIAKMHEATNTRLEYLANRIGYEFDLTIARKQVFDLVGAIPGLSLLQVFDASEMILSKVEHLDFFMSLPELARQAYVFRALDKMAGN